MDIFSQKDVRSAQLARRFLAQYGERMLPTEVAKELGITVEQLLDIPATVLPRMCRPRTGTVFLCLDVAIYVIDQWMVDQPKPSRKAAEAATA